MSDLFSKLKDGANKLSKNMPNMSNMPKNLDPKVGMAGAAGVGAVLGALFGGSKGVKKTAKNVAVVGGSAALAALAYKMYQNWSSNKNGTAAPSGSQNIGYGQASSSYGSPSSYNQGGYGASAGASNDPFAEFNAQNAQQEQLMLSNDMGKLLIEAMIFAARADGHIDAQEQEMIMKTANQLGGNTNQMIREFLNKPLDPRDLAAKVQNQSQAMDIYRLSAAAIVADNMQEQRYLSDLAAALNINEFTKQQLDNDANELRRQMSGY